VPNKILSIGCGTAFTEMHLKKSGAEIWGIDFVPESVEIAKQRIDHVICGDLESDNFLSIPEQYFDLIIATDILEHLRYPEFVIKKISKWLSAEGQLIISVPNSSHYTAIRSLLLNRDWIYASAGLFDEAHYRIFTRKSIIRFMNQTGYKVIMIKPKCSRSKKIPMRLLQYIFINTISFGIDYFAMQWLIKAEPRDK